MRWKCKYIYNSLSLLVVVGLAFYRYWKKGKGRPRRSLVGHTAPRPPHSPAKKKAGANRATNKTVSTATCSRSTTTTKSNTPCSLPNCSATSGMYVFLLCLYINGSHQTKHKHAVYMRKVMRRKVANILIRIAYGKRQLTRQLLPCRRSDSNTVCIVRKLKDKSISENSQLSVLIVQLFCPIGNQNFSK